MEATITSLVREPLSFQKFSSVERKKSALRVFLTCALQETRALLIEYQSKAAAEKCFSSSRTVTGSWDCAFALLHKLQSCLDSCLRSESVGLCYGLSAIGAAQEGLVSAVSVCNQRYDNSLHIRLAEEHHLRAKLIVNGFIAKLGQDYELESLWLQAAEVVYRRTELMVGSDKIMNSTNNLNRRLEKVREYLANAATYDKSEVSDHPQRVALRQLISRQFRRAAACTILERKHAHLYAAETYQYAASLGDMVPDSNNIKLLETAMSSMRLAGDMIAVHMDEGSARSDELIVQTITTVKRLSQDVQRLPQLQDSLEEWKDNIAITNDAIKMCTDPSTLPALQLLMEKQEQVLCVREQYLLAVIQCESMTDAATELQKAARTAEKDSALLHLHIEKLRELTESIPFFCKKAVDSDRISYCELRPMLRRCWKKAADEAEADLQLHVSLIQDGTLTLMTPDLSRQRDRCHATIRAYIAIAEGVLGSAVEYLDKARGAEAGEKSGRDPREAQMWRKAAECMVQEAQEALAAQVMPVLQLTNKQTAFATAAEYLSRAHATSQSSTLPRHHAQEISALYEKLASMYILRASLNEPISAAINNSERPIFGSILWFIALLTTSDTISTDTIQNNHRACEYGCRYLRALYGNVNSTEVWNKALLLYFTTRYQHYEIKQVNPREAAAAAVFALAADAREGGRVLFAAACVHAGSFLVTQHNSYSIALANRIIVMAATASVDNDHFHRVELPTELQQLLIDNSSDAAHSTVLEKHAAAYIMLSECEHQLSVVRSDPTASRMWKEAEVNVSTLVTQLTSYVNSGAYTLSVDIVSLIAYLNATAECYFTAAKVCSSGKVKEAWDDAIDMCLLTSRVIEYSPGQRGMATIAIEHYVLVLNARLKGDAELNTAWGKAARRARFLLEQCYSKKYETARCDWKKAECAALSVVAQRNNHTKLSKLWSDAARRWEKLTICLQRSKRNTCFANNKAQLTAQKLKREAEEQEAVARAALTAPEDALEENVEEEPHEDVGSLLPARDEDCSVTSAGGADAKRQQVLNTTIAATTVVSSTKVPSTFPSTSVKKKAVSTVRTTSHKPSSSAPLSSSSLRTPTPATAPVLVPARGGIPTQSAAHPRGGSADAVPHMTALYNSHGFPKSTTKRATKDIFK